MQKVVTINIEMNRDGVDGGNHFSELEPEKLNEYLENGYKVSDRFSTVTNGSLNMINITFILEKHE